jgi:hypothetical protein
MRSPRLVLMALLVASFVLRLWLAAGGGQGYWPDENMRYGEAQTAAHHLLHGNWKGLADELFGHADHTLFRWVAMPAALMDIAWGRLPWRAAAYFSLFSVAIIGLVWGLARRAGAETAAAGWAALLAAACGSLFYYSRHYFPYDASLALMLAGLWWRLGGEGWKRQLGLGVMTGLGFLVYNGYWVLGGAILLANALRALPDWREWFRRVAWSGLGLLLPIAALMGVAQGLGHSLWQEAQRNAGTITQGEFGQGWRMCIEYLWAAEGWLAVFLGAALLLALGRALSSSREAAERPWVLITVLFVAGLLLCSDVWHQFVVYGRITRAIVPFLCLVGGAALAAWLKGRPAVLVGAAAAVIVVLGAANLREPLQQEFPRDFLTKAAAAVHRGPVRSGEVLGLYYAEHLWGTYRFEPPPPHAVLRQAAHPLQYAPYGFEGYTREERAAFAAHDISMRLVRLTGVGRLEPRLNAPLWEGFPGPVRLRLDFPRDRTGYAEPLIVTGRVGAGDFFYVKYVDERHIVLGVDHWNGEGWRSEPLEIDYRQAHELIISSPVLFPPAGSAWARQQPAWGPVRDLLIVVLNGRLIRLAPQVVHPSRAGEIVVGCNLLGGSSARLNFSGRIRTVEPVAETELAALTPIMLTRFDWRGPEWGGAPGPFELTLDLRQLRVGEVFPLAGSGRRGQGDLLSLLRIAEDSVVLELDQWAGGARRSPSLKVDPREPFNLRVSLGGFMPEAASFYQAHPDLVGLRNFVIILRDGRTEWIQPAEFAPADGAWSIGRNGPEAQSSGRQLNGSIEGLKAIDPLAILDQTYRLDGRVDRAGLGGGFPGPVRLQIKFPADRNGTSEPLLTSGVTGAGDFIFVRYEPDGRVRFGFDHWGEGGPLSEPVRIEPGRAHELVVSAGFLYPGDPANPDWRELRQQVWVELDGRVVLQAPAPVHPAEATRLVVGVNFIGGSSSGRVFTGLIQEVKALPPAYVLSRLRPPGL